jgi:hypothetical protein
MSITHILKKIYICQITFNFVEEGSGCGSEDIKKEQNADCFDCFFFSVSLLAVMGEKITINLKARTKIEKEETHAHRTRSRSALSKERTLELRQ